MFRRPLLFLLAALLCFGSMSCATKEVPPSEESSALDEEVDAPAASAGDATADEADDVESTGSEGTAGAETNTEGEEFASDDFETSTDEGTEDEFAEESTAPSPAEDLAGQSSQMEPQAAVEAPVEAPAPVAAPIAPAPVEPSVTASPVEITNISYLSNQSGGTVVIETTGTPTYQTRMNPGTNQFVIEIANARLPQQFKRPFITSEFQGASFATINAYQNPGSTTARVVVQLKQNVEPVVQLEGSQILVIPASGAFGGQAVAKATGPEQAPTDPGQPGTPTDPGASGSATPFGDAEKWSFDTQRASQDGIAGSTKSLEDFLTGQTRFYGRPISIDTAKDTEVREVIDFIAQQSGLNIVMSDKVQGKMHLRLRSVPWDQALYIVMKVNSLGYVREGSVLRIAPIADLRKEAAEAKEYLNTQKTLSPLRVKVIPVSYAQTKDLVGQVAGFLSPNRKGEAGVIADERTSSLIVTDTAENLDKIVRLVKELDTPPTQVLIEGKVVEAKDNFARTMGLDIANLSLNATGTNTVSVGLLNPVGFGGRSGIQTGLTLANGGFDLNAFLDLSETEGQVKVVSSPRIVTVNNKEASIEQKGEVLTSAVNTANNTTTQTIQRTSFSLRLTVTPQITSDGSVIMNVNVTREFPDQPVVLNGEPVRPLNSRAAKTTVMVKTGETAVIGGIFQKDETLSVQGTLGLKDIPVLGWLFKSKSRTEEKNELMIFLTPRILNIQDQGVTVGQGTTTRPAR